MPILASVEMLSAIRCGTEIARRRIWLAEHQLANDAVASGVSMHEQLDTSSALNE
jgi:hypothetical protein